MKLTPKITRKIAKLARLNLTDAEIEKFTNQLSTVAQFAEKINQLDLTNIPETNQVTGLKNILREDKIEIFPKMKELIQCSFQEIVENQIQVRKSI